MNVRALLEDLRGQDVLLEADGNRLVVDAPAEVATEELRATLAECKPSLLKLLVWEQRKLEEADRRGLVIRWSEYPDWIELHDPLSGEWHEVRAAKCLPGVVESANRCRRKKGVR